MTFCPSLLATSCFLVVFSRSKISILIVRDNSTVPGEPLRIYRVAFAKFQKKAKLSRKVHSFLPLHSLVFCKSAPSIQSVSIQSVMNPPNLALTLPAKTPHLEAHQGAHQSVPLMIPLTRPPRMTATQSSLLVFPPLLSAF